MSKFSVRIVSIRKARKDVKASECFMDVTMNEVFEATSKADARRQAREKYPVKEGYDIGLAWAK